MEGLSSNVSPSENPHDHLTLKEHPTHPLTLLFQNNITPDIALYGYLLVACHPIEYMLYMGKNFIHCCVLNVLQSRHLNIYWLNE